GADVLREVHVAAIRGHRRLAQVLLLVLLLDQLQPLAAAGGVVHPQLAGAPRTARGAVLAADQEPAIGRPGRSVEQAVVLVADLHRVGAVGRDGPQVVAAVAVGGEGDAAAVGRPARLDVPRHARGDAGGVAA